MTTRRALLAVAIVTVAAILTTVAAQRAPATSGEWRSYGGDSSNAKYSSLDQIDAGNARDLRIAWRWSSPDNEIARTLGRHLNLFEATPVAFDGSLYVATGLHQVASIDASTGKTRWVYDPGAP